MPVRNRRLSTAALVLATAGLTGVLGGGTAAAHGSMQNPLSRVEGCFLEGAENPKSAACKAAVATGGKAALYDWMSLRIGDAAGRHRQLIADGKLCSAGDPVYQGLDLPRTDWPATNLVSGTDFTFRYRATAPHKGTFQLFLTNAGYDPAKPLAWSNLEAQPFLTVTDPKLVDGSYILPGTIPAGRSGRQLIYAIWQRSDSPEAFYSCSDVVFDGSGNAPGIAPVPTANGTSGADAHQGDHAHPATTAPAPKTSAPAATTAPAAPTTPTPAATAPVSATTAGSTPTAVAAAVPPTTAADGSAPVAAPERLAQTGSDRSAGILASIGSAFLLAGAVVVVIRSKRRPGGAHAAR
ncbi:lytic polysaccharide monooxygenase [Streptomyces sp. BE20]|uniref:lytic polysaccharide monooxygenase auxiliary activity family 9 protein n=1 Tax=unclassified Streptomyces TaxID=2593676 RepID=UPI002E788BCF|nr:MULTISPECIES: lytic polysaccharide monooxygenase [unclassified Streptomyces]MED7949762.1 lytic polysaccharide monooxygenase [Streptomyces sp. BE303]MEE1822580.1 lytic polysaccharide monooxygenase [Streptomyces sp. BE20]